MKRTIVFGAVVFALALSAPAAFAATAATDQQPTAAPTREPAPAASPARTDTPARPADNTGINARDKSGQTTLPTDQSSAKSDLDLAAAIRKGIVDDKSLSTMAQNVKVVTQNGTVTLRGPVKNEEEKRQIGQIARLTAGVTRVDNQIDVKQQ